MARLQTNETPDQQRARIDAQYLAMVAAEDARREKSAALLNIRAFRAKRQFMSGAASALVVVSLLASLLLLGGCTTTRQTVGIPTPVPCRVTLPATPDFAFDDLAEGSDIFTQVSTLLADRRQRIDYERQLEAAARSCS